MATVQLSGEKTEPGNTAGVGYTTMSWAPDYHAIEIWTGSMENDPIVHHKPVEYEGDNPVLSPSAMIVGYLYPVILYGKSTVARKDQSGEISFFGIPE